MLCSLSALVLVAGDPALSSLFSVSSSTLEETPFRAAILWLETPHVLPFHDAMTAMSIPPYCGPEVPDPEGQDHDQPDGIRRGGQQQEGRRRRLEQELVRGRRLVLWRRRPASERRHRRSIQQRQSCEETQQRTAQVKRGDPMKASGNGAPEICVQNLLRTIRGEVPYERIKGIDRTLIDKPSETAATDLAADVEFLVETYEPRVQLSDSDLKALTTQAGDFELRASIDNIT